MDFSFTEAQTAVSDLARKIFAERADKANENVFPQKLWADLAAAGLLGAAIPESEGGSGHGLLELCALLVECGAAAAPVPLFATLVLGALPIAGLGSPEQRRRLLPGVVS